MARSLPKKRRLPGVKHVVLVASGKGGVGKSTTSVNLALALSALKDGLNVGILDADIYGPSIPIMMNIHHEPQVSEEERNMMLPLTNFGIKCMSMGFLVKPEDSVVWRGPMVMGAIERMIHGTIWNPLDILIVDLPPGTGDIHLSIAQTLEVSGAVVVSTPQRVALADATKAAKMFQLVKIPLLGFVENMGAFVCTHCGETSHLFGDFARDWARDKSVPFLGSVPLEKEIMICSDEGTPIVLKHPESKSAKVYQEIAGNMIEQLKKLS